MMLSKKQSEVCKKALKSPPHHISDSPLLSLENENARPSLGTPYLSSLVGVDIRLFLGEDFLFLDLAFFFDEATLLVEPDVKCLGWDVTFFVNEFKKLTLSFFVRLPLFDFGAMAEEPTWLRCFIMPLLCRLYLT